MKNSLTIAAAALSTVIVASAGSLMLAQEGPPQGPGPGVRMRGPGGPGGGMGPMMGDIGIPLPALNLSDEQKEQVRGVMTAHREEFEQLAQRIGPAHQALQQAIETTPVDESLIRAKSAELAAAEADGAVLRAKVHAEVFALLTPEQQQMANDARTNRRMPGPRGGGAQMRQRRQG